MICDYCTNLEAYVLFELKTWRSCLKCKVFGSLFIEGHAGSMSNCTAFTPKIPVGTKLLTPTRLKAEIIEYNKYGQPTIERIVGKGRNKGTKVRHTEYLEYLERCTIIRESASVNES